MQGSAVSVMLIYWFEYDVKRCYDKWNFHSVWLGVRCDCSSQIPKSWNYISVPVGRSFSVVSYPARRCRLSAI